MSNAQEAVKTRHKETSLIFPVLALVVLFLWGSSQTLPVVIAINLLALIGILSSAFSVVRHDFSFNGNRRRRANANA